MRGWGARAARLGILASAAVAVVGLADAVPARAQIVPALRVEPASARPGATVVVHGSGHPDACALEGWSSIDVALDDQPVAEVRSLDAGSFTVPLVVPDLDAGPHLVTSACRAGASEGPAVQVASAGLRIEGDAIPDDLGPGGEIDDLAMAPTPGAVAAGPRTGSPPFRPGALPRTGGGPAGVVASEAAGNPQGPVGAPVAGPRSGRTTGARDGGDRAGGEDYAPITARWLNRSIDLGALPLQIGLAAFLTIVFAILIGFPATLFNTAVRLNHDRILAAAPGPIRRLVDTAGPTRPLPAWAPIAGYTTVAATGAALLDPGSRFDARTALGLLGFALALVVMNAASWTPLRRVAARRNLSGRWRAYPVGAVIVLGCVALTRGLGLDPGYLYGLMFGFYVASGLTPADDGITGRGYRASIGAALGAWLLWLLVGPLGDSGPALVAEAGLTTVVVGGVQGATFGLLPWKGMPGGKLFAWNRRVWTGLFAVAVTSFGVLLIDPDDGIIDPPSAPATITSVVAFAAFLAISVGTWWWLEVHRPEPRSAPPPDDPPTGAEPSAPPVLVATGPRPEAP